jgi:hypothetical protein
MSNVKQSGKCRHYDKCEKIQKGLLGKNWKGVEEALVHAILKTCSGCTRFEKAG